MKASLTLDGLYDMRKSFEKLGKDFYEAIEPVAEEVGEMVAKEANRKAKALGYSESEYFHMYKKDKTYREKGNDSGVFVGTNTIKTGGAPKTNKVKFYKSLGDFYYVTFPEYGTKMQEEKATLRTTLAEHEDVFYKKVEEALGKSIKDEGF